MTFLVALWTWRLYGGVIVRLVGDVGLTELTEIMDAGETWPEQRCRDNWGCTGRGGKDAFEFGISGGVGSDRCGHGDWVVRIVLKGQEDKLYLRAVASCLVGREGCQVSVVKGWKDGEKPIRVGYASGRYDAVERGGIVTSVAGVSAIQGRPDFASSSDEGGLFQD